MNRQNTLVAFVMVCVRTLLVVVAFVTLLGSAGTALAQPVYFEDHFEGNALKPHWIQPPPEHWEYDVSGGMLNVTKLKYPSAPHTGWNYAELWAPLNFPASGDFHAEVAMTIEPESPLKNANRQVSLLLSSSAPGLPEPLPIWMNYNETDNLAVWNMASSGQFAQSQIFANPGPLVLSITRVASEVHFAMDGSHVASLPATPGFTIQSLRFHFLAQWPNALIEPIRIDHITVVPSPATGALLLFGLASTRRRRS